jgi:ubiquinol-cytochrome c reductase cytochrome c subunit
VRPLRAAVAAAVVGAGLALAACTTEPGPYHPSVPPEAASPVAAPDGDVGRVLYLRDCAWCHGGSAEGTPRAPDLRSPPRGPADVDFVLRTRRMPLRKPDDPMRRGAATTVYSEADRAAIVGYLRTLGRTGPDIPTLPGQPAGGPAHGAELYFANCAACHGATGIGGTLSAAAKAATSAGAPETFVPPVTSSSRIEVAEAIRTGPGTMPVFGPDTFSDDDVAAIADYVQYLRHPSDPGGLATGHIGPVSEGAVGWIIGLGLLLAVSRWIGTRTGEEGPPVGPNEPGGADAAEEVKTG